MKPEVDAHEIFTWIGGELGGGKEKFEWRTEAMTVKELLKLCLDSRGVLHLLIMREGIRGWVELQLKCGSWKISGLKSFENPGDAFHSKLQSWALSICNFWALLNRLRGCEHNFTFSVSKSMPALTSLTFKQIFHNFIIPKRVFIHLPFLPHLTTCLHSSYALPTSLRMSIHPSMSKPCFELFKTTSTKPQNIQTIPKLSRSALNSLLDD